MTQVEPLLTASQVAQRLTEAGVPTSDETVRNWSKSGKIEVTITPAGRRYFHPSVIDVILGREHSKSDA